MTTSASRFEILRFMVACEQFLSFIRSVGGEEGLTIDERRRIMMYQKMILALIHQQEQVTREECRQAA
jgi:predicted HTH transcriptional regulator